MLASFCPDGNSVISAGGHYDQKTGWTSEIMLWHAETGNELFSLRKLPYLVYCVTPTPDVSANEDNTITVRRLPDPVKK